MIDDVAAAKAAAHTCSHSSAVTQLEGKLADVVDESLGGAVELLGRAIGVAGSIPVDQRFEQLFEKRHLESFDPRWQPLRVGTIAALLKEMPEILRAESDMVAAHSWPETETTDRFQHSLLAGSRLLGKIYFVLHSIRLLAPSLRDVVPEEAQEQPWLEIGDAFSRVAPTPISPTTLPRHSR